MGIKIEIEGSDVAAVQKQMRDLLPAGDDKGLGEFTLQELIAFVEKRAATEGYDLTIALPGERKSPAEQRKADARAKLRGQLEDSIAAHNAEVKPEKDDGKSTGTPEPGDTPAEEQPKATKGKKGKATAPAGNGKGETDDERKSRVIDKLVTLFNGGHKAEVNKILAEHGNGAKTFSVIPADQFGPIDEAVSAIGG